MNYTLTGRGEPTRLQAISVTGDFLQVLGLRLQRGAIWSQPNAKERAWRDDFDRQVLETTIRRGPRYCRSLGHDQ
jgi:hypothetical protein